MAAAWVIQYARKFIGAHYLWGAAGAHPGRQDGAWYRRGMVDFDAVSTDPAHPSIWAACCGADGYHVCAGAFKRTPGGRYANAADWDLKAYLASLDLIDNSDTWPAYFGHFTPRVVKGKAVSEPPRNSIVWGDDCRTHRHFDCIGFVNFVLSATTNPDWAYSIEQYGKGGGGTTQVDLAAPAVDADILVQGNHHIGLLCANGRVVQAADHTTGVHEDSPYSPTSWTGRWRMPSNYYWF